MKWHLLVVDIQKGFAPHINGWQSICDRSKIMIQAAQKLDIPVTVTEQNPSKLGATSPEIEKLIVDCPKFSKMTFSSLRVPGVKKRIILPGALNLLVVGIETHVCILQTVLDVIKESEGRTTPYILIDAVGSRHETDRKTALRRLEKSGAVLSTVESVILEIIKDAGTAQFKKILPLIK